MPRILSNKNQRLFPGYPGRSAFHPIARAEVLESRLLLSGTPTTLYSFTNGTDGTSPRGVTVDALGDVYGVAGGGAQSDGTIWELPGGAASVHTLSTLTSASTNPYDVTRDSNGNLYGVSFNGGADSDGAVWELAKGASVATTLYSFTGGVQPENPQGIARDSSGDLFGTAYIPLANSSVVWELTGGTGTPTLYPYTGTLSGVTVDSAGNLYGTSSGDGANGDGTIWEAPSAHVDGLLDGFMTLYSFANGANGANPTRITVDRSGNLYGVSSNDILWKLPQGSSSVNVLYTFSGSVNGVQGITMSAAGNLYGTTNQGGSANRGTIFELAGAGPSPAPDTITFDAGAVVLVGTTGSDTIAAGTNPANTAQDYFLIQSPGQPTVEDFFAKTSVTGLLINCDPPGSTPSGADSDYVNLGGTNFGFASTVNGGGGSDTVIGQQNTNDITTGVGTSHNLIYGSIGADSLVSMGSSDSIRSGGGADTIRGGGGNNVLVGGKDGSDLFAGSGWDTLRSGRGNSTLHGSQNAGAGTLMLGGFGNDLLDGTGSTNDTMIAGSGLETLIAGTGTYFMDAGWDSYIILQGGGTLPGATGADSIDAHTAALDTIVSSAGTPTLIGSTTRNFWALNNTSATTENLEPGDFIAENDTVNPSGATTLTVHLTIVDKNGSNSVNAVIPLGAGDSPLGTSSVRTTDANGTVVFQSDTARTFTLADFFNHWGVAFNSTGIGQFVATPGSGHSFAMTVNGVNNTQFGAYQVQNGDNIVITFTQ